MAGYSYPHRDREPAIVEPREHQCSNCFTPAFGKSALRCRNEPVKERAQAFLDLRAEIRSSKQ